MKFISIVTILCWIGASSSFSLHMTTTSATSTRDDSSSRRNFLSTTAAVAFGIGSASILSQQGIGKPLPVLAAAPEIKQTNSGIKYAILKQPDEKRAPLDRDVVAIEYTGYLTDGTIFDSTHAEGKKNALMFQVGSTAVIDGLNDMVKYMGVGEKVQAIIPPELAFGEKGICLESGECLVKPKSTLVYDIYLKRSAIPPP